MFTETIAARDGPPAGDPRRSPLTDEQRAIVEAPDGPLVVIAGAGTGKTRVIVERVRWLLETKGAVHRMEGGLLAAEPPRHGDPFAGRLLPEQLLVLTYNVKAARELQERLDQTVGPAVRARMTVSNFHSFCHRVLSEAAAEVGLPARPDVLDGVGQVLLLRNLRAELQLVYHTSAWALPGFVQFINRAKDELVSVEALERFVALERDAFEARHGSFDAALARLHAQGNLEPLRKVAGDHRKRRAEERAGTGHDDPGSSGKTAEREARRTVDGTGRARSRSTFAAADLARVDQLTRTYERDGAALEVLRLVELARVYRAYEAELHRRGALDFGEQIAAVSGLFRARPNVLRRWQRQIRYILVDEFQDANVAQIELVELLGRTPDRPDDVTVVGDDDQSLPCVLCGRPTAASGPPRARRPPSATRR